ncbi:MAG: HD-GYP domain-containing protein, partial [Gemmataceae bacterium]
AAEFAEMQLHTIKGAEYLAQIPDLKDIICIVRNHHERWDGTGYPDRLAGSEIPQLARIVAVCDAFDAITSNRPYHPDKKGKPPEVAFHEIQRQSGRQFDPVAASAFLSIREEVLRTMHELMPEISSNFLNDSGMPTAMDRPTPQPLFTPDSPASFDIRDSI